MPETVFVAASKFTPGGNEPEVIDSTAPSACRLIGGSSSKAFTVFVLSGIEKFSGTLFTVILIYAYVD